MMETEIGNHGSKSIIVVSLINTLIVVNEQRVGGSLWENSIITTPNKKMHFSFKVYSNGFQNKLSDLSPF